MANDQLEKLHQAAGEGNKGKVIEICIDSSDFDLHRVLELDLRFVLRKYEQRIKYEVLNEKRIRMTIHD